MVFLHFKFLHANGILDQAQTVETRNNLQQFIQEIQRAVMNFQTERIPSPGASKRSMDQGIESQIVTHEEMQDEDEETEEQVEKLSKEELVEKLSKEEILELYLAKKKIKRRKSTDVIGMLLSKVTQQINS